MSEPDSDIERRMAALSRRIARAINDNIEPHGFALFIFPLDKPKPTRVHLASNTKRKDLIAALKALVQRLEA